MKGDEMGLMNGRYSGLQQRFSLHFDERPADRVDLLVIHNISLPLGQFGNDYIDQLFMGSLDCKAEASFEALQGLLVAPHFLIDREGKITQYVATDKRAWHAGVSCFNGEENCNDFSLGIELEGTDYTAFTQLQYERLIYLTKLIMLDFPAITPNRIVGHSDIAPERKSDPGPHFDWMFFKQKLIS